MARLVLVRHAQSAWNALGRWQGWADPPLSERGRQQAAAAGAGLRSAGATVDVVISSDLVRAAQSARILAAIASPGVACSTDAGWREFRVGAWSGLTRAQIEERWPGALARYDQGDLAAAPGAEPACDFAGRLAAALAAATRRAASGTALVVSHGGSIRAVARLLGHPSPAVGNLSGLLLDAGPAAASVVGPVDLLAPGGTGIVP